MTGWPFWVGVALLATGVLLGLLGLTYLLVDRRTRRTRPTRGASLDELLTPPTTALPVTPPPALIPRSPLDPTPPSARKRDHPHPLFNPHHRDRGRP